MLRRIVDARPLIALVTAASIGTWGLSVHPVSLDDPFLAMIQLRKPFVFHVLTYGYAPLWFTTPFLTMSLLLSVLAIVAYRYPPATRAGALPRYVPPEERPTPSLVLGEA